MEDARTGPLDDLCPKITKESILTVENKDTGPRSAANPRRNEVYQYKLTYLKLQKGNYYLFQN
jgi:hypothetical protein